jgi:hypothetical protein
MYAGGKTRNAKKKVMRQPEALFAQKPAKILSANAY